MFWTPFDSSAFCIQVEPPVLSTHSPQLHSLPVSQPCYFPYSAATQLKKLVLPPLDLQDGWL